MGTSYPAAFDALTNPTGTDPLTAPGHASQHADANDAIEAAQVLLGRSGTSFPGSPAAGDRFRRTDRNIDYFYNGAWFSTTLYVVPVGVSRTLLPFTTTGSIQDLVVPFAGVYDLWLENIQASFFVAGGTNLSASHKWEVVVAKQPAASTITTLAIASGAKDTYRNLTPVSIGALVGVTNFVIEWTSVKTGTPGSLFLWPSLSYRLIG